jgi:hypothetical protein
VDKVNEYEENAGAFAGTNAFASDFKKCLGDLRERVRTALGEPVGLSGSQTEPMTGSAR